MGRSPCFSSRIDIDPGAGSVRLERFSMVTQFLVPGSFACIPQHSTVNQFTAHLAGCIRAAGAQKTRCVETIN